MQRSLRAESGALLPLKGDQSMDRGDAKRDLLHYNNQAHFGRDPESVFNQIQSDLITAESYGINMNLLPLGPKATASPELER